MKPVIGITPSVQIDELAHGTFRRYVLSAPYVRAVEKAGGLPLTLPPQEDVASLLDIVDGVLLSGGPDVDPARYGDNTVHDQTYGVDAERDQFEIDLFAAAVRRDIPVLGICRGIQVINVALGGTLLQDVPSDHPGAREVGHRQHERGLESSEIGHEVSVCAADLLPIFASKRPGVNSFHHQAIRDLAVEGGALGLGNRGGRYARQYVRLWGAVASGADVRAPPRAPGPLQAARRSRRGAHDYPGARLASRTEGAGPPDPAPLPMRQFL